MKGNNGHLRLAATMMCLAGAIGMVGCLGIDTKECGDLYCPAWFLCTEHGTCGPAEQVVPCQDQKNKKECTYDDMGETIEGTCTEGVCVPPECGNGDLDPGEACDNGNTSDGDRCSGDCRSITEIHIWEKS